MCHFFSAIVLKNGDVLSHPMLDSHADLVTYFQLPDTSEHIRHFVQIELTPHAEDWLTPETWNFRVDEVAKPAWWTDVAASAEATIRSRVAKMVLKDGTHPLLCDGCWIVGGTARIDRVVDGARIVRVQDTARFSNVSGGTFSNVRGGTFSNVWGGTFSAVRGGTFSAVRGGTFSNVRGGTFSDVGGGTFSDVGGGTFSDVWGGTFIQIVPGYEDRVLLDDSAKRHVVAKVEGV